MWLFLAIFIIHMKNTKIFVILFIIIKKKFLRKIKRNN